MMDPRSATMRLKLVFIIGTTLGAGILSWTTGVKFGVAWYPVAVLTTDAIFLLQKVHGARGNPIARVRPL